MPPRRDRDGTYYVENIARFRASPAEVRRRVRAIADVDGRDVTIVIEQEPGSSGKALIDDYQRTTLDGYTVRGDTPTGSKTVRAEPVAARAEAGHIRLVTGGWNDAFLDEIQLFPDGAHDDQVDALTGAYGWLSSHRPHEWDIEAIAGMLAINNELATKPGRGQFDHPGTHRWPPHRF